MPRIVIIGGGFAGIATAWRLALRGAEDVLVLERDPAPGQRASGRNAGMVRTLVTDPEIQGYALRSAALLAKPDEGIGAVDFFRRTGGVITARGAKEPPLLAAAKRSRAAGREVRVADGRFETPADGVVDVDRLLHACLAAARARGAVLRTGTEVTGITTEAGRVTGVRTPAGEIPAEVVVNAAGAWAGGLGAAATNRPVPLVALRRHLFTTAPVDGLDPDAPYFWDDSAGYYYRPESGGYLLSGCDETEVPPGDPVVDPHAEEGLAEKLLIHDPALAEHSVRNRWACLRTSGPGRRFAIGWDEVIEGLFWVAGLGGHGVTTSAAVGEAAAEGILAGPGGQNRVSWGSAPDRSSKR